ncbi:S8 family serine peptidase [Acetobacterium sp.]|uniref:S8 family serine peptidase n=1 Tax=Acetobacterium sp. TaxID=1872094 RepID=UPI00271A3292|nr:S8 family serine peptidase [Acetobacterium sp.]MDO9491465.1 S8 family serine peptidase [Acetobacterium sp.]
MKRKTKHRLSLFGIVLLMFFLPAPILANQAVQSGEISNSSEVRVNEQMTINALSEIPDVDSNGNIDQQVVIIYKNTSSFNVSSLSLSTSEVVSGETVSDRVDVLEVKSDVDIDAFINTLNENPNVLIADRNRVLRTFSLPDDPYVTDGKAWQFVSIGADKTWDQVANSETIGVAVLDTGLNTNHPDLVGRIISGYDYVTKSTDITDQDGHGTLVSGFVAAAANNGIGLSGVAGTANVKIAPYRVGIKGLTVANICAALMDAADRSDIKVINMSYGGYEYNNSEAVAIQYAKDRGKVLVASAGNEGEPTDPEVGLPSYPASYDGVISVAATTRSNDRASFSQYNNMVDLAAPGENVYTTTLTGDYTNDSGTSFSSPIVAGACGVLLAANGNLNANDVETALTTTALDLGDPGKDDYFGYGLIQLDQALAKVTTNKPLTALYKTHIQNLGWEPMFKRNGEISGSSGLGYRLEAINIILDNPGYDVGVTYRTHIQDVGWQDWRYNGDLSGTSGEGRRLEAIQINLTGTDANQFDIYYRTHVQNLGWLGWASADEQSGTAGYGYRLESIQIMVVPKGTPFDTSGDSFITNPL